MINIKKFIFLIIPISFIIFGCTQTKIDKKSNHECLKLNGYIHNNTIDIPKESTLILSISLLHKEVSQGIHIYDYKIITTESNNHIDFQLIIPKSLYNNEDELGISGRVEKDDKVIMMTNDVKPLPKNASEKIFLIMTTTL